MRVHHCDTGSSRNSVRKGVVSASLQYFANRNSIKEEVQASSSTCTLLHVKNRGRRRRRDTGKRLIFWIPAILWASPAGVSAVWDAWVHSRAAVRGRRSQTERSGQTTGSEWPCCWYLCHCGDTRKKRRTKIKPTVVSLCPNSTTMKPWFLWTSDECKK